MSDDDDTPVAVPLLLAFGGLAAAAFLMASDAPPASTAVTAPATASVTAPITNTNTITITNPAPAAPAASGASGVMGTTSLALVLGTILAVGLFAVLGAVAAAYLFGTQGGRRGLSRSGEYSYSPLTHEPRGVAR